MHYFHLKYPWGAEPHTIVRQEEAGGDGPLVVVGYKRKGTPDPEELFLTPKQFLDLLSTMQRAELFVREMLEEEK